MRIRLKFCCLWTVYIPHPTAATGKGHAAGKLSEHFIHHQISIKMAHCQVPSKDFENKLQFISWKPVETVDMHCSVVKPYWLVLKSRKPVRPELCILIKATRKPVKEKRQELPPLGFGILKYMFSLVLSNSNNIFCKILKKKTPNGVKIDINYSSFLLWTFIPNIRINPIWEESKFHIGR